jgi:hypothetical protein
MLGVGTYIDDHDPKRPGDELFLFLFKLAVVKFTMSSSGATLYLIYCAMCISTLKEVNVIVFEPYMVLESPNFLGLTPLMS